MSISSWAIDIDRDDISQAILLEEALPALNPGEIAVQIDCYAMTANNVTYAVFGKPSGLFGPDAGYWDFFAERGAKGRLPVWGFATVVESNAEGIEKGARFYGYYPMASHAVLLPGKIGPSGFTDITPRRVALPVIYNQYQRIESFPDYRSEHHDYWPVFRPLFLTGWVIADQFEDEGDYGAKQIIIASASSKTAIGLGHSIAQRAGSRPKTIGLTSKGNAAALAKQAIYDEVIAYDDIAALDKDIPSAFVDMAGNAEVTRAVHHHFADMLCYSMVVGKSHWDSAAETEALPGPARQGFFAPGRSVKRAGDWGAKELGARIGAAWLDFMTVAPTISSIDHRQGGVAALAAYKEVLAGKADPKTGIVIQP